MKKIASLVLLTGALFRGDAAQASDIMVRAKAPRALPTIFADCGNLAFPWLGGYLGVQVGHSWGKTNVGVGGAPAKSDYGDGAVPDPSGFSGGVYAGYNFDANSDTLLGLETDWQWSGLHTPFFNFGEALKQDRTPQATLEPHFEEQWAGATRLRIGYALENFLPYVAAGISYANLKALAVVVQPDGSSLAFENNEVHFGWTAGAGLDYAMASNMLLRVEYRYSDFGRNEIGNKTLSYKMGYKTQDLRFGVAYKF